VKSYEVPPPCRLDFDAFFSQCAGVCVVTFEFRSHACDPLPVRSSTASLALAARGLLLFASRITFFSPDLRDGLRASGLSLGLRVVRSLPFFFLAFVELLRDPVAAGTLLDDFCFWCFFLCLPLGEAMCFSCGDESSVLVFLFSLRIFFFRFLFKLSSLSFSVVILP